MIDKLIFEDIKGVMGEIAAHYKEKAGPLERIDNNIDFESGEFNLYFYETIYGGNELSMSLSIPVECLSAQNLKLMAFSLIDNKSSGR